MSRRLDGRLRQRPLQLPRRFRDLPARAQPDPSSSEDDEDFDLDAIDINLQAMAAPAQAGQVAPAAQAAPAAPIPAQAEADPMRLLTRDIKAINLSPLSPAADSFQVKDYLDVLSTRVTAFDIPGDRAVRLVPSLISGEHLRFYETLNPAIRNNFPDLIAAFVNRFVNKDEFTVFARRNTFYNATQQLGETVEAYSTRLRALARLLGVADLDLKNKFVASLRPGLQARILLHQPQNLQQAISFASEAERQTPIDAQLNMYECNPSSTNTTAPPVDFYSAIMAKLDKLELGQRSAESNEPTPLAQSARRNTQRRVSFSTSPRVSRTPSPAIRPSSQIRNNYRTNDNHRPNYWVNRSSNRPSRPFYRDYSRSNGFEPGNYRGPQSSANYNARGQTPFRRPFSANRGQSRPFNRCAYDNRQLNY